MKICSIFSRQKNASAESVLREWYAIFCLFLFPGEYVRMKPENPAGTGGKRWTAWKPLKRCWPDLQKQADSEKEQMEKLKAAGREKSATYRQYLGNRMIYSQMLALYQKYGLI